MTRRPLETDNLPAPLAPYSTAIIGHAELWISGQLGLDPATGQLVGDTAAEQLNQVFANLDAILTEAGKGRDDVIRVTLYLTDIAEFGAVNEVYAAYFAQPYPARTALQVAALPADGRIEADVIVG